MPILHDKPGSISREESDAGSAAAQRYRWGHLLVLPTLACLSPAMTAHAQVTDETPVQELDDYIVTGTRAPDRTSTDSAVPIDVLSQDDLRQAAAVPGELGELLDTLLPSAFMARDSNNDLADVVRTVQLRGLDPSHTLVLVNGKRRHNVSIVRGAAVDLNNIPVASIERIEVLRDGAAAQYGSDAIAGVINIVLKDADAGGSLSSTYGGQVTRFSPTDETIADGQTIALSANRGFTLHDNGYLDLTAEFRDRDATNRAGAPGDIPFFEIQTPPNLALGGQKNFRAGDSAFTDFNTMLNAGIDLRDDLALYTFGGMSFREAEGINFFRFPDSSANVPAIHPNGFIPITDTSQVDYSIVAGAKGNTGDDWRWDASIGFGGNDFDFDMENSVNASLGAASPTSFDVAEYSFRHIILNLDLSRPLAVGLLKNPLNLAWGLEYRHEMYETESGDEASYVAGPLAAGGAAIGVQGNGGLRPEDTVDVSRDEMGAYLDLETDLTDRLTMGVAGRVEHYGDFGETLNGKLSARFELMHGLALRGSAGTGFRAPSLTQAYFSGGTTDFDPLTSQLVSNEFLPATDPVARLLGAEELRPEESRNFSIGLTFDAWSGLSLSVDAYQIDIDDRIVLSEIIGGTAVRNFIDSRLGIDTVSTLRYFTNALDTRTRGLDIVVDYEHLLTGHGTLKLSAAAAYAETTVENINPNPAVLNDLGATQISSATVSDVERARPRTKVVLTGNWITDRLSVLLRGSYFGTTEHNTLFGQQEHGAEWLLDVEMEYALTQQISIAVGGNNVLDNYPDRTVEGNSYFGNFPYDIVAPIGMNGAFYYVRLAYEF